MDTCRRSCILQCLGCRKWSTGRPSVDPLIDTAHYRIWVQAVFGDDTRGAWSASQDFTPLPDGHHLPLAISLQELQTTQTPRIEWGEPRVLNSVVERYDLYINLQGDRQEVYRHQHLPGGTLQQEVEVALAGNKTYEVWVRAFLRDGSVTRWGAVS